MAAAPALQPARGWKGVFPVVAHQACLPEVGDDPHGPVERRAWLRHSTSPLGLLVSAQWKAHCPPWGHPYQTSVTLETGLWLTISGPTNSGVPYLQYCGSLGVSSCALPKSQIRTCSLLKSAIRRFSGYRTVQGRGDLGRR